jgi:hypothetical protein
MITNESMKIWKMFENCFSLWVLSFGGRCLDWLRLAGRGKGVTQGTCRNFAHLDSRDEIGRNLFNPLNAIFLNGMEECDKELPGS